MVKVKKLQSILPFVTLLMLLCLSTINVEAQDLPEHWESQDIGDVGAPGSATFENDVFTIKGSGADIWFQEDAFHFAYQPTRGDCEITAYVASVEQTAGDAKACVMIRETLDANSAFAMTVTCPGPNFGTYFQRRPYPGAECDHTNLDHGLPAPVWLRLVREGDNFMAYYSEDGNTWKTVAPANILMNEDVYIGLGVCSHNDGVLCESIFQNVVADVVYPTSVNDLQAVVNLKSYQLNQNYPNPFNPTTTIGFGIPEKGNVMLSVFNVLGEEISVLLNEEKEAGYHTIDFNASDLPSGTYFYQMKTGEFIQTRKMILMK
jgi:hypothetical protein